MYHHEEALAEIGQIIERSYSHLIRFINETIQRVDESQGAMSQDIYFQSIKVDV